MGPETLAPLAMTAAALAWLVAERSADRKRCDEEHARRDVDLAGIRAELVSLREDTAALRDDSPAVVRKLWSRLPPPGE